MRIQAHRNRDRGWAFVGFRPRKKFDLAERWSTKLMIDQGFERLAKRYGWKEESFVSRYIIGG